MRATQAWYTLDISPEELGGFNARLCNGVEVITAFNSLQLINVLTEVCLFVPADAVVGLRWDGENVSQVTAKTLASDASSIARHINDRDHSHGA